MQAVEAHSDRPETSKGRWQHRVPGMVLQDGLTGHSAAYKRQVPHVKMSPNLDIPVAGFYATLQILRSPDDGHVVDHGFRLPAAVAVPLKHSRSGAGRG